MKTVFLRGQRKLTKNSSTDFTLLATIVTIVAEQPNFDAQEAQYTTKTTTSVATEGDEENKQNSEFSLVYFLALFLSRFKCAFFQRSLRRRRDALKSLLMGDNSEGSEVIVLIPSSRLRRLRSPAVYRSVLLITCIWRYTCGWEQNVFLTFLHTHVCTWYSSWMQKDVLQTFLGTLLRPQVYAIQVCYNIPPVCKFMRLRQGLHCTLEARKSWDSFLLSVACRSRAW